jgi:hypothetical protein
MLYTLPWSRFEPTTTVVIGTTCHGLTNLNAYLRWGHNSFIIFSTVATHIWNK